MATTKLAFLTLVLPLLLVATGINSETNTNTQQEKNPREKRSDELVALGMLVEQQENPREKRSDELAALRTLVEQQQENTREKRSDELAALRTLVEQQAARLQELQVQVLTLKSQAAAEKAVREQQAQLIQSVRAQVVSQTFTLEELRGSLHSVPSPQTAASAPAVAFTVKFSTNHSNPIGNQSVPQCDQVVSNRGSGYNVTSGKFTAPVAGDYVFFLTITSVNNPGPVELVLVKDGPALELVHAAGSQSQRSQGSTLVTTHLAAGEQVWVRQQNGNAVGGALWTLFTGYLLHAD